MQYRAVSTYHSLPRPSPIAISTSPKPPSQLPAETPGDAHTSATTSHAPRSDTLVLSLRAVLVQSLLPASGCLRRHLVVALGRLVGMPVDCWDQEGTGSEMMRWGRWLTMRGRGSGRCAREIALLLRAMAVTARQPLLSSIYDV